MRGAPNGERQSTPPPLNRNRRRPAAAYAANNLLSRGQDDYGHFALIPRPSEDLGAAERELARRHGRTRHQALMED